MTRHNVKISADIVMALMTCNDAKSMDCGKWLNVVIVVGGFGFSKREFPLALTDRAKLLKNGAACCTAKICSLLIYCANSDVISRLLRKGSTCSNDKQINGHCTVEVFLFPTHDPETYDA